MTPVSRATSSDTFPLQQKIADLAASLPVSKAADWFRECEPQIAQWQMALARIPAPPFGEAERSQWLAKEFRELGLTKVAVDGPGNATGLLRGTSPTVVSVSAHIDTVFPSGTSLNVRQEGCQLLGPGISDNAAGVAALLAMASAFRHLNLPHTASLLFIGNVGEEGEGDLRGMRHLFAESEWKDSIAASVIIDGAGSDTIIAEALGSRRFEITVRGPGGHSWSDFGTPNPIMALGQALHVFSQTRISTSPKTTFNVGVIQGGTSVNSIPESASMRVDIRSASRFEIERLEMELRRAIEHAVGEESRAAAGRNLGRRSSELTATVRVIGNRPAGELRPDANILRIARAVDAHIGNTAQIQRASTDANIPLSLGREAVALGAGGKGGGAHTLQEWFDPSGREFGLHRLLLIILALAGSIGEAAE
ncbi:MAG TPA: M20/M25/M40 family metallo-hydrolase [Terriglobales bacterium]|jgi:acetylornithine deacetylase/succinyl-diaminopimelate desuccinylase-like protein|nr:M20/M25/M40 family metallo-hydrolase [Terriglobales bacterium]